MRISDLQFSVAYVFTAPPQVLTGTITARVLSHTTNDVVLDNGITIKTTNGEIDAAVAPIVAADSRKVKGGSMQMPEVLTKLLSSRRVWLALVSFVITVLGVAYPQIPPSIVQSANTLALVLIGVFTLDDTIATIKG